MVGCLLMSRRKKEREICSNSVNTHKFVHSMGDKEKSILLVNDSDYWLVDVCDIFKSSGDQKLSIAAMILSKSLSSSYFVNLPFENNIIVGKELTSYCSMKSEFCLSSTFNA